jgi:peptide-methionine (S)-S-oxide reductase
VEAAFRQLPGVRATSVGYSGGSLPNPSYEDVCSGTTGHAEAVEVEFDPQEISYEQLLETFWASHDPTTLNRQGPDVGTQYRSAIFFHTPEQEAAAVASKQVNQSRTRKPIVTEVTPASEFWPAEDYHQCYLEKRGLASCTTTLAAQAK